MAARRGLTLTALVLLCAGAGVYAEQRWGAREAPAKTGAAPRAAAPAAPVTLASVRQGDFPIYLEGLGAVQALNAVVVRSRIDGQITKIGFKEGDIVKEGQVLVEIDPRPFQASLDQANAKRAQDQANLANATLDLQRTTDLVAKNAAARQTLDTQRAGAAQLTAQIAADQAVIDSAKTQLSYATIRAPLTGRAGFRLVDQGNIINASSQTGVVTIQQVQPITVVFTAPQEQLARINAAMGQGTLQTVALSTDKSQTLATGALTTINNEVDAASGTVRLKATFENPDNKLWPGLSVVTRLRVDTRRGVVIIPGQAVQHGPSGLYVFVVDEQNKAHVAAIDVVQSSPDEVVVQKGLSPGDRIVVSGQYRVQDGGAVSVRTAQDGAKQDGAKQDGAKDAGGQDAGAKETTR